jgi:hypothetical protein
MPQRLLLNLRLRAAVWAMLARAKVELGFAQLAVRRGDLDLALHHLELARAHISHALEVLGEG